MKRLEVILSATISVPDESISERVRGITILTRALEPTHATGVKIIKTILKNGGRR